MACLWKNFFFTSVRTQVSVLNYVPTECIILPKLSLPEFPRKSSLFEFSKNICKHRQLKSIRNPHDKLESFSCYSNHSSTHDQVSYFFTYEMAKKAFLYVCGNVITTHRLYLFESCQNLF
jgi:hypothetical protein